LVFFSTSKEYIPYGTPEVVVVTVLDEATMSTNYRSHVMENRNYYAEKQGWSSLQQSSGNFTHHVA